MGVHIAALAAISVVLVDSQELFRDGLSQLLSAAGMEVVGTSNVGSRLKQVTRSRPDVVVIDPFGQTGGLESIRQLSSVVPEARILVLTGTKDHHLAAEAIIAGASGYVLKEAPTDEIISAVKASATGDGVICLRVATELLERVHRGSFGNLPDGDRANAIRGVLTSRELEILRRVATGKTNHEIASELWLSENTVKNHVARILEKLQLDNRVQAAVGAVRSGIA